MSIEIQHIYKKFGATTALDDIHLSIKTGQLVALVGPSGSGKTTLLRILAGLECPDSPSGAIHFHGRNVSPLPARERKVGMVFQHYALFRHMSVAKNIAFGLNILPRKQRPARGKINQKVEELLHLIQLKDYGNRLPHQLSGGQRQRVALARALAVEPEILLLDEPFGALDAKIRKDLRKWLREFHDRIGLTTLFVTHDQEEALELADEVVVMNHAQIVQVGTPQQVFDEPDSPFVIEFMGNVNQIKGLSETGHTTGNIYIRPHDIEIQKSQSNHGIKGKIVHIFSAGSCARITLRRLKTGEQLEAEISRKSLNELNIHPGDIVWIRFNHIRVFSTDTTSGRKVLVEKDELIPQLQELSDEPDYRLKE